MAASPKIVQLLVNPASGGGRTNAVLAAASAHFKAPRWRLLAHVLSRPEEACVLAREAARRRRHAVLVAGGDGTVNEAARGLFGSRTLLGVIPSGTGNGFARALGIPMDLGEACRLLANGRFRLCDAGILDRKRAFVNICGVGLDAWIAARANRLRWMSRISGFLRYLSAGLASLRGFHPPRLSVRVDGAEVFRGPALAAVLANTEQYGFGTRIAPGAAWSDGRLELVVVPPLPALRLLWRSAGMLRGLPIPEATRVSGKRVDIKVLSGEAPLHLDGEPAGAAPIRVRVRRGALRVMIP